MENIAFSYKNGNSFLHKTPAFIKILFLPILNIIFFNFPLLYSLALLFFQFVLSCCLKFTLKEQFKDFRPIIYYSILLYLFNIISSFIENLNLLSHSSIIEILKTSIVSSITNLQTLQLLVNIFCIIQCCSLVFRTATNLEIRNGILQIETFIRKLLPFSKKPKFSNALSLFMCFIPIVYKNWEQCKKAWLARGGKKNIKMYKSIFPVFFSVGIKQAYNTSKAMLIRDFS